MDIYDKPSPEEFLEHHGIKGQKWGVRRFQNEDGSLTSAGAKRYGFEGTGKTRKELNSERVKLYEDKYKELDKDIEKHRQAAIKYGEKNGLDLDDGGGGNGKDPNAGSRYMKMWEKIGDMEDRASEEASRWAEDAFITKYGKETVDKLSNRNSLVSQGKALAGLALAVGGAVVIGKIKDKRSNEALLNRLYGR